MAHDWQPDFEQLVDAHQSMVFSLAWRMTGDRVLSRGNCTGRLSGAGQEHESDRVSTTRPLFSGCAEPRRAARPTRFAGEK